MATKANPSLRDLGGWVLSWVSIATLGMVAVVGLGLTLLAVLAEASGRDLLIQVLALQVLLV